MARIVEYEFDPFEEAGLADAKDQLSSSAVREILKEVQDFVLTEVLEHCSNGQTSVDGGEWTKKLNPKYRDKKIAAGGQGFADLKLDGDMLDALRVKKRGGTTLALTVLTGQSDKADGHNNHSGDSKLPKRQFIPNADAGQSFRKDIKTGIAEIIRSRLEVETTKASADDEPATDAEIRRAIREGLTIGLNRILER